MAGVLDSSGRSNRLVARQLDRLFAGGTAAGLTDAQLLQRFAARGDESAFAALVERHGPMVLGVCRRWLGADSAAVDDAFQATFLILVKKARSLRDGDRLAPWLYGVALRVARRSRSQARRHDAKRRLDVDLTHVTDGDENDMFCSFEHIDTSHILDEELERLPEKLRVPLVLCYLQGLTHEQAAAQLRWPVGTVRSRMASGREKLRDRLARRGVSAPVVFLARAFGPGREGALAPAVPPALIDQTVRLGVSVATTRASAGMVSAAVSSLTDGVMHTMFLKKVTLAFTIATAGALTTGAAVAGRAIIQQAGFGGADAAGIAPDSNDELARLRRALASERTKAKILEDELKELQEQVEQLRASLGRDLLAGGGGIGNLKDNSAPKAEAKPRDMAEMMKGAMGSAGGFNAPRFGGMNPQAGAFGGGGVGAFAGMGGAMPGMTGAMGGGPGASGMYGGGMSGGMGMGSMTGGVSGDSGLLMGTTITALQPKGSGQVIAHNTETGQWKTYRLPKGVSAVPIISENVLALELKGERINELAVYRGDSEGWSTIELKEPASGTVSPIVSGNLAVYTVGDRVYAFSASAGAWDILRLDAPAQPTVGQSRVFVQSDGSISIFSEMTGKWSTYDVKSAKSE